MRVHVVDPSAYTPPYDHALCHALAAAGAEVELYTSHFAHAQLPAPDGYARHELFYRSTRTAPWLAAGRGPVRRAMKVAAHVPGMRRYLRAAAAADVVHFQWLALQHLDWLLLSPRSLAAHGLGRASGGRPLILTAHDILPREPSPGQGTAQRRLYERFDAIVVHSLAGRERLTGALGVPQERVHVIDHGVLSHLADGPSAPTPLTEAAGADGPVVLFFGLLRPYKGLDVLLEAWRGIERGQLWIVGAPRMDVAALRAGAGTNVRFDERYVSEDQLRAYFRRADLVVLPYREIDQSGVLFTALAFGKPLLLSDVGGFGELAATGAARVVPAGDAGALRGALDELLGDPAALARMAERARAAAGGEYAWDRIARRTLALYESLLGEDSTS